MRKKVRLIRDDEVHDLKNRPLPNKVIVYMSRGELFYEAESDIWVGLGLLGRLKFNFFEKARKICAICLMVLMFTK